MDGDQVAGVDFCPALDDGECPVLLEEDRGCPAFEQGECRWLREPQETAAEVGA